MLWTVTSSASGSTTFVLPGIVTVSLGVASEDRHKTLGSKRIITAESRKLLTSITAELLAGARALSLADRHHFNLNLSDLLDKSTQHKKNWLLNVIAARQRSERQQAIFEGIQTLSLWPIPS